jgi:hypothetical protein
MVPEVVVSNSINASTPVGREEHRDFRTATAPAALERAALV